MNEKILEAKHISKYFHDPINGNGFAFDYPFHIVVFLNDYLLKLFSFFRHGC